MNERQSPAVEGAPESAKQVGDIDDGAAKASSGARSLKSAITDVDTVVVPARNDGFEKVFIGENRWYPVRLHGSMRPQVKYIAVYRVAPTSAITHIAPVKSIEPWKDTGRFVVNFSEPARAIGPVPLLKGGRVHIFQGLRYTTKSRLAVAKTLDDLWCGTDPALRSRSRQAE